MHDSILQSTGNNFIDDNHDDIFKNMDELTFLVRDNWDAASFRDAVTNFINQLENHFSYEETILKGANFNELEKHTIKHREVALEFRIKSIDIITREEAINFIVTIRSMIFSHELIDDQNYWPLFDNNQSVILEWSEDYETGDSDIDTHHKSFANYINRLNQRLVQAPDIDLACRELAQLYEYSNFHFTEEEELLGDSLKIGHKENHKTLLSDLDTVVSEVKSKKMRADHVGEYLKYWLLNHIQNFDVPAFKQNTHS